MATIAGRISVNTQSTDYDSEDDYNRAVIHHLIEEARALSDKTGKKVVWVEVEFAGESWDDSGDALEFDFRGNDGVVFRTLTSEEWTEASK